MLYIGHSGSAAMKSKAKNIVFLPHINSSIEKFLKIVVKVSQIIFQNEFFYQNCQKPINIGKDCLLIGQVK